MEPLCDILIIYDCPGAESVISICSTLSNILSPFEAAAAGASGFNFQGKKVSVFLMILKSRSFTNFGSLLFIIPVALGTPSGSVQQIVTFNGPKPEVVTSKL